MAGVLSLMLSRGDTSSPPSKILVQRNSAECKAVAHRLIKVIHSAESAAGSDADKDVVKNEGQLGDRQVVLVLVDRTIDLKVPFIHDLTFKVKRPKTKS